MTEYKPEDHLGHSKELHEYGMANGHPPIADKLVLIDFDSTLVAWGPLMGEKTLTPGAQQAVWDLVARGFRIGIFTSRLSRKWIESVVGKDPETNMYTVKDIADFHIQQRDFVTRVLNDNRIPFEFITAEKVPSQAYIDDKAIGFRGDWQAAIADPLLND